MNRDYSALSREELERRLDAAEDVVVMFAWCASRSTESDRDAAAHELWVRWRELPGTSDSPESNPHLTDDLIANLARKRGAKRSAVLARTGLGEPEPR